MRVPYQLTAALSVPEREAQMAHAVSLGFPRLKETPIDERRTITLACYGPSLADTYLEMRPPIISMSGATTWLAERGIVPDFHVDMDPRANKVSDVTPVVPGVKYLMASVCHPEVFARLQAANADVTLWHAYSGVGPDGRTTYDWVAAHDQGEIVIHGGSTIGITALHIGGVLGYRHFEVHGMDGSFRDLSRTERHAGPHSGKPDNKDGITWSAGGERYATSRIMANAVAETINTFRTFPVFAVFHGHGLTQALIREANLRTVCCADETEKAATVRTSCALIAHAPRPDVGLGIGSFWDTLLVQPGAGTWLQDVTTIVREQELLRWKARYNTGTVSMETALLLRALCAWYTPKVVVEIGTFIGTSTRALMASEHLYTVDRDNDCLPSSPGLTTHPGWSSSQLLDKLLAQKMTVDLFFLDGRLQPGDTNKIKSLSHRGTVYAFDDFTGKEKGVINLGMLKTVLPTHAFAAPYAAFGDRTTLAALIPTSL